MVKFSRNRLISRRQTIMIGVGSVTTLAVLSFSNLKVLSYLIYTLTDRHKLNNSGQRNFRVIGKNSLRKRAQLKGIIYGAHPQTNHKIFARDPKFRSSFVQECGLIVTASFWDRIRPSVSTFDFAEIDYFAKFAATHKLLLRGHPLIWYKDFPDWFSITINQQNAEKIFTNHIQTVVGRYAGRMHSWDVVNEAIEPGDKLPDGFRKSPWLEFLGTDYVDLAFRIAARSDPKALLSYNEWGLEYSEERQDAVYKLLERLKAKGTPVYALGIQSHLYADRRDFNPVKFKKFLRNVSKLGLKIMITEMDVVDKNLPIDQGLRDRLVAGAYEDYLNVLLAEKSVVAVVNWGISDRYTWLAEVEARQDKSPVRPLVLDRDLKPKLAWNALARAFDRAPRR
jgi:endo-1,4-beta-xylanase